MRHHCYKVSIPVLGISLLLSAGCRRDPVDRAMQAIERNNPAVAESLLSELAETSPEDPSIHANLAIARMKLGQTDAALAGFRRAADLATEDPRPLEFMAAMAANDGRSRMTLELLLEAEHRDARSPRLQTALAIAELKLSGPQAARTRLQQVLGFAPNYSPALFNLALVLRDHLNNPSEAAQCFERYLAVAGDTEHKDYARQALTQLRTVQPATPPTTAAPRLPAARVSNTPTPAKTQPPAATVTLPPRHSAAAAEAYNSGVRNHTSGNLDRAIEDYGRALRAAPAMATAHYNLGLIFRQKKKPAEAQQAFQQALALDPGLADAQYMLALGLREQGQVDAAIEHLRSLLTRSPTYAQAHHALGLIFSENPATANLARQEFKTYVELAPKGPYSQLAQDWLKYHN
jgi:tetratricopeptide (TPR) repeat protein